MRWILTYRLPASDLDDPHLRVTCLEARVVEAPTEVVARARAAHAEIGPNPRHWVDTTLTLCVPYPEDDPPAAIATRAHSGVGAPPAPGRAITPVRGHRDAIAPPRAPAGPIAPIAPPPAVPPPIMGLGRESELTAAAQRTHQHPFLRFGMSPPMPPGPEDDFELPPPRRARDLPARDPKYPELPPRGKK